MMSLLVALVSREDQKQIVATHASNSPLTNSFRVAYKPSFIVLRLFNRDFCLSERISSAGSSDGGTTVLPRHATAVCVNQTIHIRGE